MLCLDSALRGGQKLGVSPVLESRDIANPNVEYLGVMAWAAQFQWIPDRTGNLYITSFILAAPRCFFSSDNLGSQWAFGCTHPVYWLKGFFNQYLEYLCNMTLRGYCRRTLGWGLGCFFIIYSSTSASWPGLPSFSSSRTGQV